jgi:hypothetical protein
MRHRNSGAERDEIPAVGRQVDRIACAARQKQAPRRHSTTSRPHTSGITAVLQRIGPSFASRVDAYGQRVGCNPVHTLVLSYVNCKHLFEGKSLALLRVIAAPLLQSQLFTIPVFNFVIYLRHLFTTYDSLYSSQQRIEKAKRPPTRRARTSYRACTHIHHVGCRGRSRPAPVI